MISTPESKRVRNQTMTEASAAAATTKQINALVLALTTILFRPILLAFYRHRSVTSTNPMMLLA